jgi:hypothetical protein
MPCRCTTWELPPILKLMFHTVCVFNLIIRFVSCVCVTGKLSRGGGEWGKFSWWGVHAKWNLISLRWPWEPTFTLTRWLHRVKVRHASLQFRWVHFQHISYSNPAFIINKDQKWSTYVHISSLSHGTSLKLRLFHTQGEDRTQYLLVWCPSVLLCSPAYTYPMDL